jgi:hypothetical protein
MGLRGHSDRLCRDFPLRLFIHSGLKYTYPVTGPWRGVSVIVLEVVTCTVLAQYAQPMVGWRVKRPSYAQRLYSSTAI